MNEVLVAWDENALAPGIKVQYVGNYWPEVVGRVGETLRAKGYYSKMDDEHYVYVQFMGEPYGRLVSTKSLRTGCE